MSKLVSGWYKHPNDEYPNWKVFINLEERNFYGFGIDGKKMKMKREFLQMKDYIKRSCILFNPEP